MGLPMFVPSLELIASLRRNGSVDYVYAYDRVISRPPGLSSHNTEFLPCCAGCPLSFTNVSLPTQHPRSSHPFSPEDDSVEARRYWLQFADYYRWPHVTQFSSFADLATKLRASNLTKTHERMMAYNKERLQASLAGWQWIFSRVRRGGVEREVPQDFKGAMRSLWNEERVNGPR
uniref:Uncharacterized protein n=1 Tax=Haptolina ericina TaxID=156174 RepID=A0A7S3C6N3_9EUKA|mmetsp:Transcript_8592/g.19100  ORF Transcript_8592/g.19100 Transcript_8592/m.19100 type:complete len:175 (+) Transcript_8592:230-754(+)